MAIAHLDPEHEVVADSESDVVPPFEPKVSLIGDPFDVCYTSY